MDEVKVIKVIYCTKRREGKGVELDPIRIVREIFTLNGKPIMQDDPEIQFTKSQMASFALFVAQKDWARIDIVTLLEEWKILQIN